MSGGSCNRHTTSGPGHGIDFRCFTDDDCCQTSSEFSSQNPSRNLFWEDEGYVVFCDKRNTNCDRDINMGAGCCELDYTRPVVQSEPSCPMGEYWDSYMNTCFPEFHESGYFMGSGSGYYVYSTGPSCPPGEDWDSTMMMCTPSLPSCEDGKEFSSYQNKCIDKCSQVEIRIFTGKNR